MDKKLRRWELALMIGVVCALLWGGWIGKEQEELAGQMIRLHVIANSDSQADQALKLQVRDEVLSQAEKLYSREMTLEEARRQLEGHLQALADAGQAVVEREGYSYPVEARLTHCWFPTKEYDSFSLPAGKYEALQIVIGEGEGQNWWCVAFPPLCVGAASQTVEESIQVGNFTREQAALMSQEEPGYVLKFKSMELLGQWKELFS